MSTAVPASPHRPDEFSARRLAGTPIAVVGMGGLFPQAPTARHYWQNIVDGTDCTAEVPADRWRIADHWDPDPAAPDKSYSRRGGFVPDVEFDPLEFGLPPNQLEVTSALQTLSLGVARGTLADAGAPGSGWYDPSRTGCVLGVTGPVPLMHPLAARLSTPVLREVVRSCGLSEDDGRRIADTYAQAFAPWVENSFPGLLPNVTAGRVANRLGLGGMNSTVDAACAASLSAIRVAVAELVDGRADLMLTGGADTENSIFIYLCFAKVGALSHTDRIRPFDASADGTLIGEGIGMLALKRLADARRDGDRVYAVISGLGSSSDGRHKSIYAPRAEGQRLALERAYDDAQLSPSELGLVEAHATGTAVGDRTELTALGGLLTDHGAAPRSVAIGSVKSQIGHTKGAAGTASLMKVAYALHQRVLPGTINVEQPNEALGADSALYANTRTRPWVSGRPRRGAVSAMGFGGTNFHVVLAEEPVTGPRPVLHRTARSCVLHAADVPALVALLDSDARPDDGPVPDHHVRVGFAAVGDEDAAELRALAASGLRALADDAAEWSHPRGIWFRRRPLADRRVAAVFAGQGSQYLDMGLDAALNDPAVADALDVADAAVPGLGATIFPPPVFDAAQRREQEAALRATASAQPAIGALSAGQFRSLSQRGLTVSAALGHSFGELTALWAAGSLTDTDFFTLARARGAAMAPTGSGDPGTMAAVSASRDRVEALIADAGLDDVAVCNHNASEQVVVGGGTEQVERFVARCGEQGIGAKALPVAAAFHTAHVAHAVAPFREAVAAVEIAEPRVPVVANTAGAAYGADVAANRDVLVGQLSSPVEFVAGLEALRPAAGIVVEFGPKQVLTGLVRRVLGDEVVAIATDAGPVGDSDLALEQAAARLAVLGVPLSAPVRGAVPALPERRSGGMTVTLSGAEHVPASRTEAYAAALADERPLEAVAAAATTSAPAVTAPAVAAPAVALREGNLHATRALDSSPHGGSAAAVVPSDGSPRAVEQAVGAPRPITPEVPVPETSTDVLAQHAALHTRYLDGQLDLAQRLVDTWRTDAGPDTTERLRAVADHADAMSRAHVRANEVLASLAALDGAPALEQGAAAPAAIAADVVTEGSPRAIEPAAGALRRDVPPVVVPSDGAPRAVEPLVGAPRHEVIATNGHAPTTPSTPEPAPEATGFDTAALRQVLVEVVADKTGYPASMVNPGLDLEADLGVDSIKRVQVLGAVQERYPQLPAIGPESMAELRTLDQIVEHFAADVPAAPAAPAVGGFDAAALRRVLVEVVADKTGYPASMVDPGLDLEADLGVDSIKRVQVLGAVQERYPQLPAIGPESMAELRTLDQIVAHFASEPTDTTDTTDTPATPAPAPAPVVGNGDLGRHAVELVDLPDREDGAPAFAADPVAVLVDRGGPEPDALEAALTAAGWTVRRVGLPETIGCDWLNAHDERTVDGLDEALTGRVDAVLVALRDDEDLPGSVCQLADAVLIAGAAKTPLTRTAAAGTRAAFVTVTRIDGGLGLLGHRIAADAALAGVGGLVKTLAREAPGLFCRALDIAPVDGPDAAAAVVLAELGDAATDVVEVGVDAEGHRRTVRVADRPAPATGDGTPVGGDDVVVVTGGARGVTASCVRELVRRVAPEVVLLGRTALAEEPAWAVGVPDDGLTAAAAAALGADGRPSPRDVAAARDDVLAQREVRATLEAVRAHGATARYAAVDVTDADQVRDALADVAHRATVLVHAAGALADAKLEDKTRAAVHRVLAPKLAGLHHVTEALRDAPLHTVVLFGSVAGVHGNPGQADYALANEALARIGASADRHRAPRHVTTLSWGAWDGGMVTPDLREHFRALGVPLIDPDDGSRAFADHLTGGATGWVLLGAPDPLTGDEPRPVALPATTSRDLEALREDPVLAAHRIGDDPVLPATVALGWMIDATERRSPDRVVTGVRDLAVRTGLVFGAEPAERLTADLDAPGPDGTVAVAVRGAGSAPRYSATLRLGPPGTTAPPVRDLPTGAGEDASGLYRRAVLFHGPVLQGVRRVLEQSDQRVVLACELPLTPLARGAYAGRRHDPVTADVVLHGPLVLGHRLLGSACLPLAVGRIELDAVIPAGERFVLLVENPRASSSTLRCDVTVCAADGRVLQRWIDVEVVTTAGMDDRFARGVASWNGTATVAGR
ncbi:type I polyketide synthase [Actinomycetospora chiangmaiensis]|uniref:type I polyketide synthase n=1 Tax=Actinomycetospora chiangmaiensis TaxID=402650 RepID=UPI000377587B|nr:type I polyketide synthase [Actinomycetospora chiangmaiensis]